MGKPNSIRKKALDFARKRQWDKALVEFEKLVEIELHNPNLFNEIGDLHIKLDNKRDAFKSFHKAVDAYTKVGLHNNAVAVCKKIIRLNPGDHVVYGKLARLRHQQGFHKEAETYSIDFFEKSIQGPDVASDDLRDLAMDIAFAAEKSPAVLEKAAEYLLNCDLGQEAGSVLEKLYHYHSACGNNEDAARIMSRMEGIGFVPAAPPAREQSERLETVESHRSGVENFGENDLDSTMSSSVPPHIRGGKEDDVAADFGVIEIGGPEKTEAAAVKDADNDEAGEPPVDDEQVSHDSEPEAPREFEIDPDGDQPQEPDSTGFVSDTETESDGGVKEFVIPDPAGETSGFESIVGSEDTGNRALLNDLAAEVTADVDEDDFRSHYDLGMAYVEMALLDEAVREFQYASSSPAFRVRSLEMIGRCFIEQEKPQLAIKQLTRGLALVGKGDKDALGIKYNLGLAYEMIGDGDNAQAFFEDVYVVDVTFRDIEEKVKKYAT